MSEFLIKVYEEYNQDKTIKLLEDFTEKTFPKNGTDKVFIGCVLILINNVYKSCLSGEALYTVVASAKKKVNSGNLLKFYVERINGDKLISKYLYKVIDDINFDNYVNLILEYLEERSYNFITRTRKIYEYKFPEMDKDV